MNGNITNNGNLLDVGALDGGVFVSGTVTGSVTNVAGARIETGPTAVSIASVGGDFINDGIIASANSRGVAIANGVGGDFINRGMISGADGAFIRDVAGDVRNEGTLSGTQQGLELSFPGGEFINTGAILGDIDDNGPATALLLGSETGEQTSLTNADGALIQGTFGSISGVSSPPIGSFELPNTARGDGTVLNAGTLVGDVDLGEGDDTFVLFPTGDLQGNVEFGPGTDTLAVDGEAGTTGNISLFADGRAFAHDFERLEKRGAGTWIFEGDWSRLV